jgi:hypothetical protein
MAEMNKNVKRNNPGREEERKLEKQCCGSALVQCGSRDLDPAVYLNADPDPDPGSQV